MPPIKNIKSLIIDDDQFIIDLICDKLEQFVPDIELMATANSGLQGIEFINKYQPDLIFLDVEMDDMTGFEMLTRLKEINFKTIFITSYSHYAIKAIRFNALDYLVKPIDLGELKRAIHRYKVNVNNAVAKEQMDRALKNLKIENVSDQVLSLQTQEGLVRIPLKEIILIEGERNYSSIHLSSKKKILSTKSLGSLEEILTDKGFFRTHKSHLINYFHITSFQNKTNIVLSNNVKLPIARRKKSSFIEWYNNFEA